MYNTTEELLLAAAAVIPGGVNSGRRRTSPTICIRSAKGAHVEDIEGNTYIDYHGGAGTIILGYCDDDVDDAVREALRSTTTFGIGVTEAEVVLAQTIVECIDSVEGVLVCNSGSEATFNAIRLARAVTGRQKILKFQGCYHGFHDYALANNQSDRGRTNRLDPGSAGMLDAALESIVVARYNDLESVTAAFQVLPDRIAAVIVEPVAHNAPGIRPAPGFLEGLRAICDTEGAVLIFDEVITGFRHDIGGFQAISGVPADLTIMGKAIANGYPIAAVGGKMHLLERFNTDPRGDVVWAGTYNGNAVGVNAALATIRKLRDGTAHNRMNRLGDQLREGLEGIGSELGIPVVAAGYGSLFALLFMDGPLESYDDVLRNDVGMFEAYRREMIARGILELPDAKATRSHLTASHTETDIDQTLEKAREAMMVADGGGKR